MKKKIIMMMLALTVVTNVTACGTKEETSNKQATATEERAERESNKKEEKSAKKLKTADSRVTQTQVEQDEEELQEYTKRLDQVKVTYSEGGSITLNVPEGYNWNIGSEENENGCFFDREDGKETVFVGFWDRLVDIDEAYCDEDLRIPYYATGTESEVMTEEINGRTVYYKHIQYEYEEYNGTVCYETVKAMCEVGDNRMLVVETSGLSGEEADFDEIRGFFEFEEE